MKVKKVEVKKLIKLLKKNEKAMKELIDLLNKYEKEPSVSVEALGDVEPMEITNGVKLDKANWKEYLDLLTSSFKTNEDGSISIDILIDVSASSDLEVNRKFLYACKDMMKYHNVRVGCFDTKFYGYHTLIDEEDINNFELIDGNGTDFEAAIDAFDHNVPNRIIFTDGGFSMPKDSEGAYWIVTDLRNPIYPNNGTVIYLDKNIIKEDISLSNTK